MTAKASALPTRGYLATPLTSEERRRVDRLYREHGGLVNHMGRKMCKKFPALRREDIFSSIDIAFIKTCRKWDPKKGRFSTVFAIFCEGEIRHFIRDHNWEVKAPGSVRSLGLRARYMLQAGSTTAEVCTALHTSPEALRLALFAIQSLDHDIEEFRWKICPRPTPWDTLDATDTEQADPAHCGVGAN